MNTFWLKIAGAAIGLVVVIVLIAMFTSGGNKEPEQPARTFDDVVEEDREKFLAEPQALNAQKQTPVPEQDQPAAGEVAEDKMPESEPVPEPVRPVPKPAEPPKPTTLYFKPLSEINEIEAQRLLNAAVPGRSLGRLRTGFKLMMDNCRQIIKRWPDSWYAYRAKQMIADMPVRYREQYRVTEEELDLSIFAKPRPGTEPFVDKEAR